MTATGIIAEYNPFHNGHEYQLREARKQTGADYIIIAMSGDFLQRGVPAVVDKYSRTRMALLGGADLVLELPAVWATASAEYFAAGGIQLLGKTGVVSHICFGCETADHSLLTAIAQVLTEKEKELHAMTASAMKKGISYPAARSRAVCTLLPEYPAEKIAAFLASPNNILALEYEKACQHWNVSGKKKLTTAPIERIGEGYHSTNTDSSFASATAARKLLQTRNIDGLPADLSHIMPETSVQELLAARKQNRLLDSDDFSQALYTRLWSLKNTGYVGFADCGADLSARIGNQLEYFRSFLSFAELLKSKNITYTHVCRALLHIMLDIRQDDYTSLWQPEGIPYLRVLGFRKSAKGLLSAIKKEASVPLLTKAADASDFFNSNAENRFLQDVSCADLYRTTASLKAETLLPNEYRQPIVIIP